MSQWIVHLVANGGYIGIAFLMFLENVFPPIPSEIIMGLAGIEVGQGQMNFEAVVFAGTVGSTLGNYAWYLLGRFYGFRRLEGFVNRWGRWLTLEWEDIQKINRLFTRHGGKIVFVLRFMPAFRTIVSLPAGLFRMGHLRFLIATFAGAMIWNVILTGAGYYLGRNFSKIDDYVGPISTAAIAAIVLFYIYRVITWKPRAQR
ncbi:DedA family protein [Novosphingopyxis sp. YJ-S2-01]|uniref:DedA family protein n=1 Tax=Novosphingopyxis sp. YJ-S2-01 TaxID=2794021 RepID=UPI0018DD6E5A|nr:DedA family protein [Novosphingopyxis sp. YJ-S2-01]